MLAKSKSKNSHPEAQNPLILRAHRLMEAFAKSDDERDFYLDKIEGFIIYVDLDKTQEELDNLESELEKDPERYSPIPKLSFFESKKIMESFVNEKVYDIDTKEKLLDIIQSKEARDNFLEFIYDHHMELEKWQQFYQERSRIRIIEWLRSNSFNFVFEEDLDLSTKAVEKLKEHLFDKKVPKDVEVARKTLMTKAKSYYSNEALNPRPKRGRPPKQQEKVEMEPQVTVDIYTTVPSAVRAFLFTPDITSIADVTFSSRFETGKELLDHLKNGTSPYEMEESMNNINAKLAQLRELSSNWMNDDNEAPTSIKEKDSFVGDSYEGLGDEDKELFLKLEEKKNSIQKKKEEKKPVKKKIQKVPEKKPVKRIIPKEPAAKKTKPTKRPIRKLIRTKPAESQSTKKKK
ncbi:UPF0158 family protein [Waddlia chondrophila]|uniref:Uncharacterized protein n=1 Tax=Waddlia chondrophila (strain ATCC VR-1470 / WSU 86-1044) TaxID=716544 RepID=D6YRW4_WADCW|nr:UPF0158 family protein [Waddlia chondrophila]ADI38809.1 conserved hypothetical protein [Waddlia chondrophila WSU 86-1044]